MTFDVESLESQLRHRPSIADDGFSQAVVTRIALRQRRRRQILVSTGALAVIAALVTVIGGIQNWAAHLQPLTASWTMQTGQLLHQVSDASLSLQSLWQPAGGMIVVGLTGLLLTAVVASAWD